MKKQTYIDCSPVDQVCYFSIYLFFLTLTISSIINPKLKELDLTKNIPFISYSKNIYTVTIQINM